MQKRILALGLALAALFGGACARDQALSPADEAFNKLGQDLRAVDSPADKVALAEFFLAAHPGSSHTVMLVGLVAYYRGEEMNDPAGAREIARTALAGVEDPEARFEINLEIFSLTTKLGETMDLAALVAELTQHRALSFGENLDVAEAGLESEGWALAVSHSDGALALATAEAYRSDYPDTELDDEKIAAKASHRRHLALVIKGRALAKQGLLDDGMATFAAAAEDTPLNYLGLPETGLHRYWGDAYLDQGDFDRAMELLAPEAVMANNGEALASLRLAYAGKNGGEEGFDEYLTSTRNSLAKPVDDFTLPTYDGQQVTLSALQGKVVLLNFWFPT